MRNRFILLFLLLLFSRHFSYGQQKQIFTIISQASNEPITGAQITFLKTGQRMTSDDKGQFKLTAFTAKDTLSIHALGFQELRISVVQALHQQNKIFLQIQNLQLHEVIVNTGYQQLDSRKMPGAIEKLDQTQLERNASNSLFDRIDGMTTAIDFDRRQGKTEKFTLRGLSTLSENRSTPLIVLDGFPYQGDPALINPEDVAQVTFLKDASSSAIWGVGAANGVVVITTKKGGGNGLKINYSSTFSLTEKPNLFWQKQMSNVDFLNFEEDLFNRGYFNSIINNTRNRPIVSPYIELLNQYKNGKISTEQLNTQKKLFEDQDVRKDFDRYIYRNSAQMLQQLSINTGDQKAMHHFNIAYNTQQANLTGNHSQYINLHEASNVHLSPFFDLQTNLYYTQQQQVLNAEGGYGSIIPGGGKGNLYPYASLADQNGTPLPLPKDVRFAYIDTAGKGRLLDWKYKPLDEISTNNHQIAQTQTVLNVNLNIHPVKEVRLSSLIQYEHGQTNDHQLYARDSYYVRNLVNRYTTLNGNNITRNLPYGDILDQSNSRYKAWSARLQLDYQHQFNPFNDLSLLVGSELRSYTQNANSYRYYGYDHRILTLTPVDYTTSFPIYGNLSSNSNIPNIDVANETNSRNVSIYAIATYVYHKKYTLSSTVRRDASNLFGANTNNKWQPLWSVGQAGIYQKSPFILKKDFQK